MTVDVSDKGRIAWVDHAKGLGIFLVVLGHIERGLVSAGIGSSEGWLPILDKWIYFFHMPLFFWVSGLFATRRSSGTWAEFLLSRFRSILYPYFVWAFLQTFIQILMSGLTNSESSFVDLARIPYSPPAQFWFLYALFLVSCLQRLLAQFFKQAWTVFGIALLLHAFAVLFLASDTWAPLGAALYYLLYFSAGAALSLRATRVQKIRSPLALGLGLLCLLAVYLFCTLKLHQYLNPVVAGFGIAGVILVSKVTAKLVGFRFLANWGRASLQIYVAHVLAGAGFRIGMSFLGTMGVLPHLLGGVAAGISMPLLLDWIGKRLGMNNLFTLKKNTGKC